MHGRTPATVHDTTDARGEFVLGSIAPGAEVRVSARAGLVAESSSRDGRRAGDGRPVTLRLKKHPTLALSGRVLGPDGRPLAGVAVRIKIRSSNQNFDRGSEFAFDRTEEVTTGPDGTVPDPGRGARRQPVSGRRHRRPAWSRRNRPGSARPPSSSPT